MRRRSVLFACTATLLALAASASLVSARSGPPSAARPLFRGAKVGDFTLNQSAPGAVSEVRDPTGRRRTVFKMTVDDGDVYPITPTDNPRASLLSPSRIRPGHQYWWSAEFLLPRSFPASLPGWLTLLEGPYGPPFGGTPPWHIEVTHRYIQWSRNGTYGWDVPWQIRIVRGRWVRVLVHFRFGVRGFVEMWVDGHRISFFRRPTYNPEHRSPTWRLRMSTMDSSNDRGPNFVSIMSYRKAGMLPSLTLYQGPTLLGTTRSSVGG